MAKKRIAHVLRTSGKYITVFRWHGTRLEKHRYLVTDRNRARYECIRDRLEESEPIPF